MFRKLFKRRERVVIPDQPIGFGYKNRWLAIKSTDQDKVAEFLGLRKLQQSNWKEGVAHGYRKGVFVTPEIKGWILVLGLDIPDVDMMELKELLKRVSTAFGECQVFISHRIVDYYAWGIAMNGQVKRLYSFVSEEGNLIIEGEPTEVEKAYNLVNTYSEESKAADYWDREDIKIPDGALVMQIAGAWSVNPSKLGELEGIKGIGLIGV